MEEIKEKLREFNLSEPTVIGTYKDSMKNDNPVYGTEIDGQRLQFINSSNQRGLSDFDSILEDIADELDDRNGEIYDRHSGNQIYWEIVSVDEKGSLLK